MSIPTGWREMRQVIIDVLRDHNPTIDGELYLSGLQLAIEAHVGDESGYTDWDDRSHIGRAFYRALQDLRESGEIVSADSTGYMLAGTSSSLVRNLEQQATIADVEEQMGPEVASLVGQLLLRSAQERERLQESLRESAERDLAEWKERAERAEKRLWRARRRLEYLLFDDEADWVYGPTPEA